MKKCFVADGDIVANNGVATTSGDMDDGAILNIGVAANYD